jgi:ABC-type nitrate/sulfonate/bicarbonate transport system substrate-binding protein
VAARVVVGAFTPSVLLSVARRTGRLAEQDLEVEEVPVSSSPGQFRSLLDGELDIALTSPDNVLAYRFDPGNPLGELADVRIVATVDRGMGLGLYARPGLDPADLDATATFGVDVPSSGFALAMYAIAETFGVPRADLRLDALGSTPRRLEALREGRCDATMLNAGNELPAEAAGCRLVASVADVCPPYVGTVLCVLGEEHLDAARRLARALLATARDITGGSGEAASVAAEEAATRLGLPEDLATRFVERMSSRDEGLILADEPDLAGLRTIVELRRRFLPAEVDGTDVLAAALEPSSGLVDAASPAR